MKKKSNWIIKSISLICVLLMMLSVFAGCGGNDAPCTHEYENGVCTICETVCPHKEYEDGKCKECGMVCDHDYNKKGVCKICGTVCKHEQYEDGECLECGVICTHEYEDGVCTVCGTVCVHKFDKNGVCEICELKCAHDKGYEGGVCKICKVNCKHDYKNGVCEICKLKCPHDEFENERCKECGIVCSHEKYDDNGVCENCGKVCTHDYENGVCTICKYKCKHKVFENETCKECGIVCSHEKYDENGFCANCGRECEHSYNDKGKCKTCGKLKFPEVKLPAQTTNLARVSVVMENLEFPDATREVPYYDNEHPENNIDWQYSDCLVTVDNCAEEFELVQTGGFKVRGNWTTTYPKKPFRIKFDKKQNMLGLHEGEKFKSWVLLADYKDISLERNSVALYMGKEIFGEDGFYCSDFQQVELYLNGEYWGVYLLVEQQQVNENRISVTEPEKGYTGTDIGYFFEYDGYYNLEAYNERFSCNYNVDDQNAGLSQYNCSPLTNKKGDTVYLNQFGYSIKSDIYDKAQKQFIKNYVYNVYKLAYCAVYRETYYTFNDDFSELIPYHPETDNPVKETVSRAIDIQSLVDMYIHCEIACDYDLGWSSFLMDVDFGPDAKDNLLRFEAPWDFDSAFGLRDACASGEGLYAANANNPWMLIFINEDWFWQMVGYKWRSMEKEGFQQSALALIYDLRDYNAEAYEKNFNKWGFVKNGECTWEIQQYVHNQSEAAEHLHNWLKTRFDFLNSEWQ